MEVFYTFYVICPFFLTLCVLYFFKNNNQTVYFYYSLRAKAGRLLNISSWSYDKKRLQYPSKGPQSRFHYQTDHLNRNKKLMLIRKQLYRWDCRTHGAPSSSTTRWSFAEAAAAAAAANSPVGLDVCELMWEGIWAFPPHRQTSVSR